jgi:hypothetical protein
VVQLRQTNKVTDGFQLGDFRQTRGLLAKKLGWNQRLKRPLGNTHLGQADATGTGGGLFKDGGD